MTQKKLKKHKVFLLKKTHTNNFEYTSGSYTTLVTLNTNNTIDFKSPEGIHILINRSSSNTVRHNWFNLLNDYEFLKNENGNYYLNFSTNDKSHAELSYDTSGQLIITINENENGATYFEFDLTRSSGFNFSFDQPGEATSRSRKREPSGGIDG